MEYRDFTVSARDLGGFDVAVAGGAVTAEGIAPAGLDGARVRAFMEERGHRL